jgi:hypothetical protein
MSQSRLRTPKNKYAFVQNGCCTVLVLLQQFDNEHFFKSDLVFDDESSYTVDEDLSTR